MVYLYKGKLPNYAENTHALFDTHADYVEWLGTPFMAFEEDNYRLNGGQLEVALPAVTDTDEVTYAAWNYENNWRFYFVQSNVYQSGFAIFQLALDQWATFLPGAKWSNIRVTRCNRDIGTGIYDPIAASQSYTTHALGAAPTIEQLAIAFVVVYGVSQSSSASENRNSSGIGLFLQDIVQLTGDTDQEAIERMLDIIGGIYAVKSDDGELEAKVVKAYIVPSLLVPNKVTLNIPSFKYATPYGESSFTPSFFAGQGVTTTGFDITIDPRYKYYAGTRYNGLELVRTTKPAHVTYNFITGQDDIQVIARQGDRSVDITSSFQVGLTTNDGNLTSMQKLVKTMQTVQGIAMGGLQMATGAPGVVAGGFTIANALVNSIPAGNARYIPGGDAMTTFLNIPGALQSPYGYQQFTSISDELANARLYGAVYNEVIESLGAVFDYELLGDGLNTDTFIVAECRVDGVPAAVCDTLVTKLQSGVHMIKI